MFHTVESVACHWPEWNEGARMGHSSRRPSTKRVSAHARNPSIAEVLVVLTESHSCVARKKNGSRLTYRFGRNRGSKSYCKVNLEPFFRTYEKKRAHFGGLFHTTISREECSELVPE